MKKRKGLFLMLMTSMLWIPAFAQETGSGALQGFERFGPGQLSLLIVIAVISGLIILLLGLLIRLMYFLSLALSKETGVELEMGFRWPGFRKKQARDQEEAKGKVLEHHSYDGITELDNFMPPWLQYVFFLSIGFGIVYFINYSVLGWGKTQMEEYQEELFIAAARAEERKLSEVSTIDETNVQYDRTTESLAEGKSVFDNNCVACHASDGGGGVGPNLTDEYWIHGGSINEVFAVVKYGVPEKGMIPWQDQLSPEQIQYVSSYILTLSGTTPLNPKEPQGERYEPAIEQPTDVLGGEALELEEAE